jgi:hypothetical protein
MFDLDKYLAQQISLPRNCRSGTVGASSDTASDNAVCGLRKDLICHICHIIHRAALLTARRRHMTQLLSHAPTAVTGGVVKRMTWYFSGPSQIFNYNLRALPAPCPTLMMEFVISSEAGRAKGWLHRRQHRFAIPRFLSLFPPAPASAVPGP